MSWLDKPPILSAAGALALLVVAVIILLWLITLLGGENLSFNILDRPPEQRLSEQPAHHLLFTGDVLLSRHVGAQIDKTHDPELPFKQVAPLLQAADIAFANLECPLSDSDIPIREGLVFRCLHKYVPGLVSAGFDVLSTANNHALDQGLDNLEFTIDYLRGQGILPVGTFKQSELSNSIHPSPDGFGGQVELDTLIKRGDTNFGFLAYSYTARNDGGKSTHPQIATIKDADLLSDIAGLKSRGADIIIVSMHAGAEYTRQPNQEQISFAHAAIDAGADIVIGHHPHWIQPVEIYKPPTNPSPLAGEGVRPGRTDEGAAVGEGVGDETDANRKGIIFYSLGNFVFDQMWSEETREGLMVQLTVNDSQLTEAKLIPVIIDNFCCPRLADETEKNLILNKIGLGSDTINLSK